MLKSTSPDVIQRYEAPAAEILEVAAEHGFTYSDEFEIDDWGGEETI